MSTPWTVKYKPQRISEFVDNEEAVKQLDKWLTSWESGKPSKKASFLHGSPGIGKNLSVEILAREHGFELVEMNASDWRSKESLERMAYMASSQTTLFGVVRRIVILDELEGLSESEDRGGLGTVTSMVKEAKFPLVLIADNAWNTHFAGFREYCLLIEFKRIPMRSIAAYLKRICDQEGIRAEDEALRLIAERARGDLRSAITDLQTLSQGRRQLTFSDVDWLDLRDKQENIFEVMRMIFTAKRFSEARRAVDVASVDYMMLFEWIYENLPHQLTNKEDLANGLEVLAKADVYLRRIKSYQDWSLLKYTLDLMTGGVALSREKTYQKWVPFKFPERIRMMARTRAERHKQQQIGTKFKDRCHISVSAVIKEYLPYLRIIFQHDREMASKIVEEFDLEEESIDYLSEK